MPPACTQNDFWRDTNVLHYFLWVWNWRYAKTEDVFCTNTIFNKHYWILHFGCVSIFEGGEYRISITLLVVSHPSLSIPIYSWWQAPNHNWWVYISIEDSLPLTGEKPLTNSPFAGPDNLIGSEMWSPTISLMLRRASWPTWWFTNCIDIWVGDSQYC